MEIFEVISDKQKDEFLEYLDRVDCGAAKMLSGLIKTDSLKVKNGPDSKVFYAKDAHGIFGFFALVNKDYMALPYDRFISSVWVDPKYRGRGLAREFVAFAERVSDVEKIYILSQHKGLYEKMGYELIDVFTDSIHDMDYLYEKKLIENETR